MVACQGACAFEQLARDIDEIESREYLAGGRDGLVADEVGGPQQFCVGEHAGEADRARSRSEVDAQPFGPRLQGDELREGGGVEVERELTPP